MKTLYVWQCGEPRTFKEGECEIGVRYDIRAASEAGHKEHPVKVMCELGFAWDAAVPESIGDCWFFRVKEMVAEKPFLTLSDYRFKPFGSHGQYPLTPM